MDRAKDKLFIKITPRNGGRYKSISELSWENIPSFAILTGKNGSGKTQLLEILAYHLSGAFPPGTPPREELPVEVKLSGVEYQPEEIAYIPSGGRFSGGPSASLAEMPQQRQQVFELARNASSRSQDIAQAIKVRRALRYFDGGVPRDPSPVDLEKILPDDFEFMLDDVDVTSGLTYFFVAHRLKILESLERGTPEVDREGKPLGPAPWDVVNESLAVADFPYKVIPPSESPILQRYELRFRDVHSGQEIRAIDLSSGEKTLLQLVLWLYSSGKEGVFPKLLLLDEPDAYLHPSMTMQFMDVVSEVLVNKHGVRVIMTTHSPSTVALAPDGSLFQLSRGSSMITRVDDRQEVISTLTAGLVTVSRSTKFCFVEDEGDLAFYEALREILTDYGPSRDPHALKPSPSVAFIPASVGAGATKVSGGSSIVEKWVNKLDAEPLNSMFLGITDRDANRQSTKRIKVIGRYSFENYLLDPLNIFCLLLAEGKNPTIAGLKISSGDEHLLRAQPDDVMQAIADQIAASMEACSSSIATANRALVTYTVGKKVTVPAWVIDYRGHDLLQVAQAAFGGTRVITPRGLVRALRRGRLVPVELAALLADIQAV